MTITPATSIYPTASSGTVDDAVRSKNGERTEGDVAANSKADSGNKGNSLSPEEQAAIAKLEQRDREVRAHEQAHLSRAGAYVRGGARYTYETGPDGKRYAVGGEVSIDTSPERTPEATIQKAAAIRAAALAPADPSAQDYSVAASASAMELEARQEMREEKTARSQQGNESSPAGSSDGVSHPEQSRNTGSDGTTAVLGGGETKGNRSASGMAIFSGQARDAVGRLLDIVA